MATIFEHFSEEENALIDPCDTTGRVDGFPKVCITTFSEGMIETFVRNNPVKIIANLYSANGAVPVYEVGYGEEKMGLFLSRVGAPACAAGLEEVISMGAEAIVQFGCCGILNESLAEKCMRRHGIPYVTGKVWTTDAIYRETRELVEERKRQGCIAVEMEGSASMAVARFRKIPLIQFFYGADSLDGDSWEIRDLTDYGIRHGDRYMAIALECGIAFAGSLCTFS